MRQYELLPQNGRKSFGGKAKVRVNDDGGEVLQSYFTDVIRKDGKGGLFLICDESDLSMTTCTHIKSYCGLTKRQVLKLPRM